MSDYWFTVGDLVTDRVFKPERVGIIVEVRNPKCLSTTYMVHWMGFSKSVAYRDWEIKKVDIK